MSWTAPTASEFKSFFARDFLFAQDTDPNNLDFVINADIDRAVAEAQVNFNAGMWANDAQTTNVFMYLAAFMLVRNIQMSTKGLSAQTKFPIASNAVGSVSVSFQIPEAYAKDPFLSSLTANAYGMKYLELLLPRLSGNVYVLDGGNCG